MTTTDERPAPTEPRLLTAEDAPKHSPDWCDPSSHLPAYMRDLNDEMTGVVDDDGQPITEPAPAFEVQLEHFQQHHRHLFGRYLPTLTSIFGRELRASGAHYSLDLDQAPERGAVVTLGLSGTRAQCFTEFTSGEARVLAAQLVRCADRIDAEEMSR